MSNNKKILRSAVLIALFSSTAIALGYALVALPNIELVTAILFLSGMMLGWKRGLYVAVITYLVFSIFNPFGFPNPLLLLAQITGAVISVIAGWLSLKFNNLIYYITAGFIVTLLYDILTNVAGYLIFVSKQTFIAYIIGGLSFSLIHIVSNMLVFTILLYPLRNELLKFKQT